MAMAFVSHAVIAPAAEPAQGIQWASSFEEAMARAKAEKKPVFIEFFNPN
jgi:hypothetical protein